MTSVLNDAATEPDAETPSRNSPASAPRPDRSLAGFITRRPSIVFAVVAVVTALLVVPFLTMAPTESASTEPSGTVFDARDRVDDRFVSSVRPVLFIAEHDSGDLLRAAPLRQLAMAEQQLRANPTFENALFEFYDVDTDREISGIVSIVDLVERELRSIGTSLDDATDADVARAARIVIDRFGERSSDVGISAESRRDADGRWIVPAVNITVLTDDSVLGFGNTAVTFGGGTDVEEFDRAMQALIRDNAAGYQVNGVAIDVNLTSEEQGAVAGPFIGFTILAVLLIVGLAFRSYWILAIVGTALVTLIVWLKGISNLIGLEDDLVLSLIVPIAMVSFGVDFAFHSIGRYREERAAGRTARPAVVTGLHAVSGALILALASDSVAFLSNVVSGIDSIVQFGLGAAVALAVAFLLLGFVAPLAVAHVEERVAVPAAGRRSAVVRVIGAIGAASLAMTSVLLLVFILPWLGVIAMVLTAFVTIGLPMWVRSRAAGPRVGAQDVTSTTGRFEGTTAAVVSAVARRRLVVLPLVAVASIGAGFFATQVPAEFDVEDFFSGDTDFVVSLDQLDRHVGDRGGEPATIYVEGDIADPAALALMSEAVDAIERLDSDLLAQTDDGRIDVDAGVLTVFETSVQSPAMLGLVEQRSGIAVTDDDGNGIPDTREQAVAVLDAAVEFGVPLDAERLAMTPDDVQVRVDLTPLSATRFDVELTDTRSQDSVLAVQASLQPIIDDLAAGLGGTFVEATGGPIVRAESLQATNRALNLSLPIAVILCLVVATTFLRSLRYGIASIIPILVVVAWLYAFMYFAGFAINLVTATIAAVSIGIGIDFAIHFIARYREELERSGSREQAVAGTASSTGTALIASAVSSAVGFGILALAPMPLFASYGLLTAIMILMAVAATLLVLPAVLMTLTRDRVGMR